MVTREQRRPNPRRGMNMKTNLCLPRFRASSTAAATRKNPRGVSPALSLLDRLREAVLRLIMLSALSKAAAAQHNTTATGSAGGRGRGHAYSNYAYNNYPPQEDPHHSEAVADCIEFIKKSATTTDDSRNSTASSLSGSSVDAAADQVAFPFPVMSYT